MPGQALLCCSYAEMKVVCSAVELIYASSFVESSSTLPAHEESLADVVEDIAEDDPRKINNFELRDLSHSAQLPKVTYSASCGVVYNL